MASTAQTIALRFQRQELQQQADLSPAGLKAVANAAGPRELIEALAEPDEARDAVAALALMLPRRQAVWWACLMARLLPDAAQTRQDAAAVDAAEAWVQTQSAEDSERAYELAEQCAQDSPARWAATAAYFSGASLAPRGQEPVPPPAHLAGVAARITAVSLVFHTEVSGRVSFGDLLAIGTDLMHGDLGRRRQSALRERMAGAD
jgi:hypothetical protein